MRKKRQPSKSRLLICHICDKEFYGNHSQSKYCSPECSRDGERKSWREYGKRNKKKRSEFGRKHYLKNKKKRLIQIKTYRQTPQGKLARDKSVANMKRKYPLKYWCRLETLKARRKGLIVKKPCEVCGILKVEVHHDNYSKPFIVRWLCKKHHAKVKAPKQE